VTGRVELPPLRIFLTEAQRHVRVAPEDVLLVRTWVVKEELVRAWVFAEESSSQKLRLPERYPVRTYETELFLRSGKRLRGHVRAASFWVAGEEEDSTFILRHTHRGETGQAPEDLVYVRELRLGAADGAAGAQPASDSPLVALDGVIPGAETLVFLRRGAATAHAFFSKADGRFAVHGLVPGRYDVVVRGTDTIVHGLRGAAPSGADRERLLEAVAESREFFEEKQVLASGDAGPGVWLLVGLRRRGRTSAGNGVFVRYELWRLARLTPRWEIQERIYLFRSVFPDGTNPVWPEAVRVAELGGIDLSRTVPSMPFAQAAAQALRRSPPGHGGAR
jgi:hypothetical protein